MPLTDKETEDLLVENVAELVNRCTNGDDEAKASFCANYHGLVQRAVGRKLGMMTGQSAYRSEIDDICNDVFANILKDDCRLLSKVRKPSSLDAWLVTLAQNSTVDFLRKCSSRIRIKDGFAREQPGAYASSPASPADEMAAKERKELVKNLLDSLPSLDRLIVKMFYIDGLKYTEISEITGMNINTVSARLRRAKGKMRNMLEEIHG